MYKGKNKIIVLNGISGAGKSTLINNMFGQKDDFAKQFGFSVSHTSRKPRPNETEQNYHFVSKEQFEKLIQEDQFLEYTQVHGNYYGTSFKAIDDVLQEKHIILDIDVKGSMSLLNLIKQNKIQRNQVSFILISPPSLDVIRQRLAQRNTETEETIQIRLNTAKKEFEDFAKIKSEYNYEIINIDIQESNQRFRQILQEIIKQ